MDGQTPIDQLEELTALAANWAAEQERRVLCEGVPLSERELADAKIIGVRYPERVRLLRVEAVPVPAHPMLAAAAASIHFLTSAPRGLALEYGIFVRSDHWRDRALIAHELVHTAQFQRLGGILPFLQTYIFARRNSPLSPNLHIPMRNRRLSECAFGIGSSGDRSARLFRLTGTLSTPAARFS